MIVASTIPFNTPLSSYNILYKYVYIELFLYEYILNLILMRLTFEFLGIMFQFMQDENPKIINSVPGGMGASMATVDQFKKNK